MNFTTLIASDTTLNYLKNGGGSTSDKYATAKVANWTSSYSYSAPLINTASKDNVYGAPADGKGSNKTGIYYNFRNALTLPLSGYFFSGIAGGQNYTGDFWASSNFTNSNMDDFHVETNSADPAYIGARSYGNSVRCVAK